MENSSLVYEKEKGASQEPDTEELYAKINKLELEKEFLKKAWGGSDSDRAERAGGTDK
ncbi:hypothetical protein CLV24_102390 [Pontibacter ummariensis]|uniref:Uncharacterized protein n=1 Tax=Pontibacter ummariensis TaxID=1610492 RepID=A0A239BLB4_9BACT|nr:hypothetical protein [Pontibacter ummariensis]PRY15763.1 hypothetical protein CLV24_102390 [Pontibacter ummariensis]SNS08770.1 hypothetical protein SAMN06296052_10222 [Pontibacter ummariensis]